MNIPTITHLSKQGTVTDTYNVGDTLSMLKDLNLQWITCTLLENYFSNASLKAKLNQTQRYILIILLFKIYC